MARYLAAALRVVGIAICLALAFAPRDTDSAPKLKPPKPGKTCYLLAAVGYGYLTTNSGERLTC